MNLIYFYKKKIIMKTAIRILLFLIYHSISRKCF